ncbi:RAM signaling network component [Sporothrix epigloea]|uniref:RAM signaling network component n=1 Tax=Sporothrix epigloea TaxID=1892477 RepID=A0ABP0D6E8_9PEZI
MDHSDRYDRPGLPHGVGTLPASRGLPDNPAQNRRLPGSSGSNHPIHSRPNNTAAAGNGNLSSLHLPPPHPPPPPMPTGRLRKLTTSTALSAGEVIALAREAMKDALQHADQQAGDDGDIDNELKPGLTIDLSYKNIQKLPEEVVDIVMNKLERLALSHNELSSFPARFAECSSLRYLNVRDNDIREFPLPLCNLQSLEILDLSHNKLQLLPPEITKLTSLKVFAVQKNQIEELPLCLADMASLQMLKLYDNPIRFPPPEVFQVQACSPPNEGHLKESEVTEITVTSHVKKFLKQVMLNGRAEVTATTTTTAYATSGPPTSGPAPGPMSGNGTGSDSAPTTMAPLASSGKADAAIDDSPDPPEPARFGPPKRVTSGRFPIKVNGAEVGDSRSPNPQRPPPIPTRSHYRGLSQQNSAVLRPSVMPLAIGNVNERFRSNSETTLLVAGRGDRSRRMGIVSKKAQELGTLDETEANNRFSHYRGLSHGSAMTGHPVGASTMATAAEGPASLVSESASSRPLYVRHLSVLPVRRRESRFCDPVVEAAKGVLYSIFQIHPMIQVLMSLANDGSTRRSSLEIVVYNTNSHVQQLECEIQRHELAADTDESSNLENESVHNACVTLLHAYDHICSLLMANVDLFLENGDPRYMRTLLLHLYQSIMELRVASAGAFTTHSYINSSSSTTSEWAPAVTDAVPIRDTLRPRQPPSQTHVRDVRSVSRLAAERPNLAAVRGERSSSLSYNPSDFPAAADAPESGSTLRNNQPVRTAMAPSAAPHADEHAAFGDGRGAAAANATEKERLFERIHLSLQKSTDVALRVLPSLKNQYAASLRAAMAQRGPDRVSRDWRNLLGRCATAIQQTETLKSRLSTMKSKSGTGLASLDAYWGPCLDFYDAWYSFADTVRSGKSAIQLPPDTRARLRPLHECIKDTARLILRSPWAYILRQTPMVRGTSSPRAGAGANPTIQLPMTPWSAALGPAVQATVPSTPQGTSFSSATSGHLPERADTLSLDGSIPDSVGSTLFAPEPDSMASSTASLSRGITRPIPYPLFNGNKVAL